LGSFLFAGKKNLISSPSEIMADGYVCLSFLFHFTTTFGINAFGLCNCVESIDAYEHILWLGSFSSECKDFEECWRNPIFFGILKFAAKEVLSAVEEAHARTWLTDMEV
jgi:hypothetical protein